MNEIKRIIDGIKDLQKRVSHLEANMRRFDGHLYADLHVETDRPTLDMYRPTASTDEKYWRITSVGSSFSIQTAADAPGADRDGLRMTRVANQLTALRVGSSVTDYNYLDILLNGRGTLASDGDLVFGVISGICLVSVLNRIQFPYHNSLIVLAQHDGMNGTVAICGQSAGAGTAVSAYSSGTTGLVFSASLGTGISAHNYFAYSLEINYVNLAIPIGA